MNIRSKILLVEDDLSMGFLLSEFLESEGFEVKLCRIKVILRRQAATAAIGSPSSIQHFHLGEYSFDYARQELCWKDETWRMTEKENEVLRQLCLHRNQILRRDDAVEKIYGKRDYFLGRSFDVFISKLRKLLQNDPRISIENVFRVGFILNVPEEGS